MQQRYYDPQIGRFLSGDPVSTNASNGGNFNRYWYTNDNPYRFTDPDGRVPAGCDRGNNCQKKSQQTLPLRRTTAEGNKRIDIVIAAKKLDTHGAEVSFDPKLVGADGTPVSDTKISIGRSAFTSESKLGAVIEHEIVHVVQKIEVRNEISVNGAAMNEAEACQHNIENADRLNNSPGERADFNTQFHYYYDNLPQGYKDEVSRHSENC